MDRYINATRLLDKLDADIKMLDNYHTWEASAISYVVMILLELSVNYSAVPAVLLWTSRRLRLKTIEVDE